MRIRKLETELWLPLPIEEVFAFFSDAGNLAKITPPWMNFRILTPLPVDMRPGTLLDYRLKVRGLPIRWRTEILEWDPPHRFVDHQVKGPYKQWLHKHIFEPKGGGTSVRDEVDYAVPGWVFEPLLHWLFVGPDVRKIFAYRAEKIDELLLTARHADKALSPPNSFV
ncbi:MAG: SRPBCC family protein [Gemmataceae bacterium]|nr:SRPBCC family protein [Gemmataceae bacterium]MCI0737801.1 SRPBCC family protein [Gemmataceae bacterium]